MVISTRIAMSVAEFDTFAAQQEDLLEFIGGEVFEVPSNPYVSKIAIRIATFLSNYLMQNDIGHVTGEAGGYMVAGERYAPDVAFISYEKQPELSTTGYNPKVPDLAVEVISDTTNSEEQRKLRLKLTGYLAANVTVWIVNPTERIVEVYQAGRPARVLDETGILTHALLPDFALSVKDIFPTPPKTAT